MVDEKDASVSVWEVGETPAHLKKTGKNKVLRFFERIGEALVYRLFDKQIEAFEPNYHVFVWDAPHHAALRPFEFSFSLMDKARRLDEILCVEGIDKPVIIGQFMGGYVGQAYAELFPQRLAGLISLDSVWRESMA